MGNRIVYLIVGMALFSLFFLSNSKAEEEYIFVNKWPEEILGLRNPSGLAMDSLGNIYVADTGNHRVQKFTSNGSYITKWGVYGNGNGQLCIPYGVAVDDSGNVYVADTGNDRIQKFSPNGTYLTQWGTYGWGNGQFDRPFSVAVDSSTGNVYVADTGHDRIQKFTSNGIYITKWGTNGLYGGEFFFPMGIAVDNSGNVYVADTINDRVQKFASDGTYLTQWGNWGTGNGQFSQPKGIAVDSSGNVYVVDFRVQKFTSSGTYLTYWGTYGWGSGQFDRPFGIVVDNSGYAYVADNHRIQKFTSGGAYITQWGNEGSNNGQFIYPQGIAVNNSGNVYIADTDNHRIQKFISSGTYLMQWGSYGWEDDGQFEYPCGVAVDSSGNVYIADTDNDRIQKFTSSGIYLTQWGWRGSDDGEFYEPEGVTVDDFGNVYVADTKNNRIQKFTSNGTYITRWGTNGVGNDQFVAPTGVAIDNFGNVYVVDWHNYRVQKFDSNGTYLTQWGSEGFDNGKFNRPRGIAVDDSGNVYVADTGNHRVQKFTSNGSYITKWGVYGNGNGQMCSPYGVAVDGSGNVYVADTDNDRIQVFQKKVVPIIPDISLSQNDHNYHGVKIGNYVDWKFTIFNDGNANLMVNSVLSDSPSIFQLLIPIFPQNVIPGGNLDVTIRFFPSAESSYNGNLTISSNDPDEQQVFVSLEGRGVSATNLMRSLYINSWLIEDNDSDGIPEASEKVRFQAVRWNPTNVIAGSVKAPIDTTDVVITIIQDGGDYRDISANSSAELRSSQVYEFEIAKAGNIIVSFLPSGSTITSITLKVQNAKWIPNAFVGGTLNPNINQASPQKTYTITGNTVNTITVQLGSNPPMTDIATDGDPFSIVSDDSLYNTFELKGRTIPFTLDVEEDGEYIGQETFNLRVGGIIRYLPLTSFNSLLRSINDSTSIDSGNNGNGKPEPGETLELTVTLRNASSITNVDTVVAELDTDNQDVNIVRNYDIMDYGDIQKGRDVTKKFRVEISPEFKGNIIVFQLFIEGKVDNILRDLGIDEFTIPVWNTQTSVMPDISVSQNEYDFQNIFIGNYGDWKLSISNNGNGNLTVNSVLSDKPSIFQVLSPTFPQNINPGGNLDVTIRFTPPSVGSYSGNLTISSNDPDEVSLNVKLMGKGVSPSIPKFLTLPFKDSSIKIQQGWIYSWDAIHNGIDYIKGKVDYLPWESFDVLAAAGGVAMWSSGGGYGDFVLIRHNEVDLEGKNYFTLYSHLASVASGITHKTDRFDTAYSTWSPVSRGQYIGKAGATGVEDHPDWIHLHFEVNRGGYAQNKTDPYDIYKKRDYYPGWNLYTTCGPNYLWTSAQPSMYISAKINSYSPGSPVQIEVGKPVILNYTFINTGETAWKFIAGASVWQPDGTEVSYEKELATALQPGVQTTVNWSHTVNQVGNHRLQFAVWKAKHYVAENLLIAKPSPSQVLIIGTSGTQSDRIRPDQAAQLAKTIFGADYLWGGKGYDLSYRRFVSSEKITSQGYNYYNPQKSLVDFGKGLDCSGLNFWAYNRAFFGDKQLTGSEYESRPLYYEGANGQYIYNVTKISKSNLMPGDLFFFDEYPVGDGIMNHVAMYIGPYSYDGKEYNTIHASGYTWDVVFAYYNLANGTLTTTTNGNTQVLTVDGYGRVKDINPPKLMVVAKCPVGMVVTTPDGEVITRDMEQSPTMEYQVYDIDGDGELNDIVVSEERKAGDYQIQVVPNNDALPTDTYSLEATVDGTTTILAEDVQISNIPVQPYIVPSESMTFTIYLEQGWNLVSLPISPLNKSIASVMSSVIDEYVSIWTFDPASKNWLKYVAESDPAQNNLNTMDAGTGYLVYMSGPGDLMIQGTVPDNIIYLKAGWNLVGYPSQAGISPQNVLADMPQGTCIYGYDNQNDRWLIYIVGGPDFLNNLDEIGPGQGYYIYINQDMVWVVSP